jgi:hypothetical protein
MRQHLLICQISNGAQQHLRLYPDTQEYKDGNRASCLRKDQNLHFPLNTLQLQRWFSPISGKEQNGLGSYDPDQSGIEYHQVLLFWKYSGRY